MNPNSRPTGINHKYPQPRRSHTPVCLAWFHQVVVFFFFFQNHATKELPSGNLVISRLMHASPLPLLLWCGNLCNSVCVPCSWALGSLIFWSPKPPFMYRIDLFALILSSKAYLSVFNQSPMHRTKVAWDCLLHHRLCLPVATHISPPHGCHQQLLANYTYNN